MGRRADTDKVTRARAVAARYEAGKVFHHISLKDSELEIELASFPKGHDDLTDALGLSFDLTGTQFSWSFVSVA
jgi:phage terminase large subunit-like protein